jgi:hypothetical protein
MGGVFQNPAFILLTLLTPQTFEGNNLTNYITGGLTIYSALLGIASVIKMSSSFTLFQLMYSQYLDSNRMNFLLTNVLGYYWIPELLYYVLPSFGTTAYFLSMN